MNLKEENQKLRGLLDRTVTEVGRTITSELRADIDTALSQQAEPQKSCRWTRDEDTGAYETACGETWHLIDGGEPEEHGQYYCHHCGKQIDDEGDSHE